MGLPWASSRHAARWPSFISNATTPSASAAWSGIVFAGGICHEAVIYQRSLPASRWMRQASAPSPPDSGRPAPLQASAQGGQHLHHVGGQIVSGLASSSTTRRRPCAASAAQASPAFMRPSRSLCPATTVVTSGISQQPVRLRPEAVHARADLGPGAHHTMPGLRRPLRQADNLPLKIRLLIAGRDAGVQTQTTGRFRGGAGVDVHQDRARPGPLSRNRQCP
jgi:hypothetical protein